MNYTMKTLAVASVILFFCVLPVAANFPTFHSDNARTGFIDAGSAIDTSSFTSYSFLDTKQKIGAAVESSPIIVDGCVYFGTSPHKLAIANSNSSYGIYCYDLSNNQQVWTREFTTGTASGITSYNNCLYLGSIDGKLYSLDQKTGDILWSTDVIDETEGTGLSSTPLVVNNVVYVTTQTPATLYGFSLDKGAEVCHIELTDGVARLASPSYSYLDSLIYSSGKSGVVAVNATTQEVAWEYTVDETVGTPVYSNGSVFFETPTKLYSIKALQTLEDGGERENWGIEHAGSATTPAVTDTFIVANGDKGLSWYYAENGTLAGNHPLTANSVTSPNSPIVDGDIAYYTVNEKQNANAIGSVGILYAVNLTSGDMEWSTYKTKVATVFGLVKTQTPKMGGAPITYSSPAVFNGQVFVGAGTSPIDTGLFFNNLIYYGGSDSLQIIGSHTEEQNRIANTGLSLAEGSTAQITISGDSSTVPVTTIFGALETASKLKGFAYSLERGATEDTIIISDIAGRTSDSTTSWNVYSNGILLGTDIANQKVANGDELIFTYGGDPKTTSHIVRIAVSVQTKRIVSIIGFTEKEQLKMGAGILQAVVTNADGVEILGKILWESSDSEVISLTEKNDTAVSYTTGTVDGSSAIITITYEDEPEVISSTKIIVRDSIPEPESATEFLTYKGNYARTGVVNTSVPDAPEILWDVNFREVGYPTLVDGHPVVHNGNVYFTTWGGGMSEGQTSNGLYCYNATTGEQIWHNPDFVSRTGLSIYDGKIYGGNGHTLACVYENNGTLLWQTDDISYYNYVGLTATPLIYNDTVYVVTYSLDTDKKKVTNYVYAYDLWGNLLWTESAMSADGYAGGTGMYASISMSPNNVIYVPGGGGVIAMDATTHEKLWTCDLGARGPAVVNIGQIVIPGGNDQYLGSPVYKDQHIYIVKTKTVYCIDAITGKVDWSVEDYNLEACTPVVTDDKVIASGVGLTAYDLLTGEKTWYHNGEWAYRQSPIATEEYVVYGTYQNGHLYCVNITDGSEKWRFIMPKIPGMSESWYSIIEATPAIENGILYVGAENGHFYAFKTPDLEGITIDTPAEIIAGTPAYLTGSVAKGTASYTWEFGDGSTGNGAVISKVWKTPGTYTVNLTADLAGQIGGTTKTITVKAAPAAISDPVPAGVTVPATVPDDRKPVFLFDKGDSSADVIAVTISTYDTTAPEGFTPPNSAATILYLTVDDITGITDKTSLKSWAKVTVNVTIDADNRSKLSFWRYADGLAADSIPELLQHSINATGDGWITCDLLVPGFSAIVGSVSEADIRPVSPPAEPPVDYGGADNGAELLASVGAGSGQVKPTAQPTTAPVADLPDQPSKTTTVSPTAEPTGGSTTAAPTTPAATASPTQAPAPAAGILAGLGIAALTLRRRNP